MNSDLLLIAGALSLLAAVLHLGVIFGGPNWYRFFGAGEAMASMAEQGSLKPAFITLGITAVLMIWGAYAWSGAGLLPKLPLLKLALVAITGIYLIRGIGGLFLPFVIHHPSVTENSTTFWVWSSLICIVIGGFHLIGIMAIWSTM